MASLPVYYTIDGQPFTAAAIPLPASPYPSPKNSPQNSPTGSAYGVHLVPLPPSPTGSQYAAIPVAGQLYTPQITPLRNPAPLPPLVAPATTSKILAREADFKPHPMLDFDAENPRLQWDVRLAPSTVRIARPPFRPLDHYLDQHAVEPPWTFMRLKCELLPWMVECSNPQGVTLRDVLDGIWDCLRQRPDWEDWEDTTRNFQESLLEAAELRARAIGDVEGRRVQRGEERVGVRQVDWLLWDFQWLGIKKSSEPETWVMFFRSP